MEFSVLDIAKTIKWRISHEKSIRDSEVVNVYPQIVNA